jgi:ABC-2 type transport system ATP-binding protein
MKGQDAVIEVKKLTKSFGANKAVDALSFRVHSGHVTGFLGPNGAGKSTTLRSILGLITPSSGSATVRGAPYVELTEPARVVGALLETQQFHPQRSARNHLKVLAAAAGFAQERVDEVLEEVDLAAVADRKVGAFSLGMRQRLGLAAALLGDPETLILDEPANGLDPAGIRWLRSVLRSNAARGRAVLVSSHLLDEVAHIADEVVVIDRGRFITQAPIADLVASASGSVRVATPQPERLRDAFVAAGIYAQQVSATDLLVRANGETVWKVAVDAAIPVTALRDEQQSLEDIFFELTSRTEV